MSQRPIPERLAVIELDARRAAREASHALAEARRSAEQAEGAIEDVRTLSDLARVVRTEVQQVGARVMALSVHFAELAHVSREMADEQRALRVAVEVLGRQEASTRATATEARTKASGAHRLALEHEARLSDVEGDAREWAAQIAIAKADGDALAKQRSEKVTGRAALGGGGLAAAIPAIIAALQGQALTYAIGVGLGIGAALVGAYFLIRHFRKAKP